MGWALFLARRMTSLTLFPFAEYWWFYALFTVAVIGMLALDLGVFHRESRPVGLKEAFGWTVTWAILAMVFCFGFWQFAEWRLPQDPRIIALGVPAEEVVRVARLSALEFLTGYVIELSLSVDNIFVFVLIFAFFRVPASAQHKVLFWGIAGALVMRVIFILVGVELIHQFHWLIFIFGAFLIFTGIRFITQDNTAINPDRNLLVRMVRKIIPITADFRGDNFFVR